MAQSGTSCASQLFGGEESTDGGEFDLPVEWLRSGTFCFLRLLAVI